MSIVRAWQKSRTGVLGTLILAPLLYAAGVLLAPTPALADSICQLVSCQVDADTCYFGDPGTGICCIACYNYECLDGSTFQRCRTECGAQC